MTVHWSYRRVVVSGRAVGAVEIVELFEVVLSEVMIVVGMDIGTDEVASRKDRLQSAMVVQCSAGFDPKVREVEGRQRRTEVDFEVDFANGTASERAR